MGEIIDKYHLNMFCICSKCKKKKEGDYAYSCKQYNKEKGIPAEIWNKENAECPYFESMQEEVDKNQVEILEQSILKNESEKKHRMKKVSALIRMK